MARYLQVSPGHRQRYLLLPTCTANSSHFRDELEFRGAFSLAVESGELGLVEPCEAVVDDEKSVMIGGRGVLRGGSTFGRDVIGAE